MKTLAALVLAVLCAFPAAANAVDATTLERYLMSVEAKIGRTGFPSPLARELHLKLNEAIQSAHCARKPTGFQCKGTADEFSDAHFAASNVDQAIDAFHNRFQNMTPNDFFKTKQLAGISARLNALGDDSFRVKAQLDALNALIADKTDFLEIHAFDKAWGALFTALGFAEETAKKHAALKTAFEGVVTKTTSDIKALKWIGDQARADDLKQIGALAEAKSCGGMCDVRWETALQTAQGKLTALDQASVGVDQDYRNWQAKADKLAYDVRTNTRISAAQNAALTKVAADFKAKIVKTALADIAVLYADARTAFSDNGISER